MILEEYTVSPRDRPSNRVPKKMENYVESFGCNIMRKSDDYAEETPDYAETFKINKGVPLAFSNV